MTWRFKSLTADDAPTFQQLMEYTVSELDQAVIVWFVSGSTLGRNTNYPEILFVDSLIPSW
jgi:hypothetical protein